MTTKKPETKVNIRERKFLQDLYVPLTELELKEKNKELHATMDERDKIEAELALAKEGFKKRIENRESAIWGLRSVIKFGVQKSIECNLIFDFDKKTVTSVRLDTGVVLGERAMSDDERQEKFQFQLAKVDEGVMTPAAEDKATA